MTTSLRSLLAALCLLAALTGLGLGGNRLATLPPSVFDNLTKLERLDLDGNRLAILPSGVFDRLAALCGSHSINTVEHS